MYGYAENAPSNLIFYVISTFRTTTKFGVEDKGGSTHFRINIFF